MTNYLLAHQNILILLVVWSLLWKGFALWRAGRENQKYWFIAIMIINTFGILEIFYLYILPEIKKSKNKPEIE